MTAIAEARARDLRPTQARAFIAVLRRDVFVTGKELPLFLAQVILQPLFLLLVFGKVLGALGYTKPGYADLLFPGLLSLTAVLTGLQTLAFPLVIEFGWTKEIEDRLLAPMATGLVAAEKLLFASARAVVAATRDDPRRNPGARAHPLALGGSAAVPGGALARAACWEHRSGW